MDPCCSDPTFCGCYLGGAIGGGILEARQSGNTNVFDVGFFEPVIVYSPSQLYNNQFQGMAFIGYGRHRNIFYFGGEFFASAASHVDMHFKESITAEAFHSVPPNIMSDRSVKASIWQFGMDFRPGASISPVTLLYARVGVSAAKLKAKADSSTFTSSFATFNLSNSQHRENWKATFRLGLGLEYLLTSPCALACRLCIYQLWDYPFKYCITGYRTFWRGNHFNQ